MLEKRRIAERERVARRFREMILVGRYNAGGAERKAARAKETLEMGTMVCIVDLARSNDRDHRCWTPSSSVRRARGCIDFKLNSRSAHQAIAKCESINLKRRRDLPQRYGKHQPRRDACSKRPDGARERDGRGVSSRLCKASQMGMGREGVAGLAMFS